jgi:hypothetical protein
MKPRYVLIDHENEQPRDLALLDGQPLHVMVFLGVDQKTVSTDLAIPLQARGADAKYIRIGAKRRNALDFHIAFYLGELAAKDPSASFLVIAKDGDYDPLLDHLRSRGIDARRSATLAPPLPDADDAIGDVITYLQGAGTARPRRVKTLGNAIKARRGSTLDPLEIERLIAELVRRGVIAVSDGRVTYP